VVVVAPNSKWNWIPSNIWVGVGQMDTKQVTFPLAPIYKRKGIEFHQALATRCTARAHLRTCRGPT
jgi:sulfide:quinone oxidoreductase